MRVKYLLHASFCSKNWAIKKTQTFNPQLRFWQVLNKNCVFWLFYIDLLLQCCQWRQQCNYAWVSSCTLEQLRGLLSSFVDSLSMRTSLYNSSLLYFLLHSEWKHSTAHMKMRCLEKFFWVRPNHFTSTKKEPRTISLKCEESSYQYWVAFFLFQKWILISFEFSNMRELFGFARMQTNLNKFKGHSEGKRRASCVVLF